jgi:hypothetical protein
MEAESKEEKGERIYSNRGVSEQKKPKLLYPYYV